MSRNEVTIVGRVATTSLKRGERATVERTSLVDALIERGFVREDVGDALLGVVEPPAPLDAPETAEEAEEAPERGAETPGRAASKRDWRAFLAAQGYDYDEAATRDELIEVWDGTSPR